MGERWNLLVSIDGDEQLSARRRLIWKTDRKESNSTALSPMHTWRTPFRSGPLEVMPRYRPLDIPSCYKTRPRTARGVLGYFRECRRLVVKVAGRDGWYSAYTSFKSGERTYGEKAIQPTQNSLEVGAMIYQDNQRSRSRCRWIENILGGQPVLACPFGSMLRLSRYLPMGIRQMNEIPRAAPLHMLVVVLANARPVLDFRSAICTAIVAHCKNQNRPSWRQLSPGPVLHTYNREP